MHFWIRTIRYLFLAAVLILVTLVAASPQTQTGEQKTPQMRQVLSDDFNTDSRDAYKIAGEVTWDQGKLVLGNRASLERKIKGGSWAKMEVDFGQNGWAANEGSTTLGLWFRLEGASHCFVRIRKGETKERGYIALVDTGTQNGQAVAYVERETPITLPILGPIQVTYRHGLVSVRSGGKSLFHAFIEKGAATLVGLRIDNDAGARAIERWNAYCVSPLPPLSEEKKLRMPEIESAKKKVAELYRARDLKGGIEEGRKLLRLRTEVLGEEHLDCATSLNNLALLYDLSGDYEEAESLYLRALAIRKSVLGEEHPIYATTLNNLGTVYMLMGRTSQAEQQYEKAAEIRKRVLGTAHPEYAASLNHLASLYKSIGNFSKSEELFIQAHDLRLEELGAKDTRYGMSVNNLASLYIAIADYPRAEKLYQQALEICRDGYGEAHPNFAVCLNNLASLYQETGECRRAEKLYRQALDIWKNKFGERHPNYALTLNNLASLSVSMGDFVQGESLYVQARDIREEVYGTKHQRYIESVNSLAAMHLNLGEYDDAEPLTALALRLSEECLPKGHPVYATSVGNQAGLYEAIGKIDEAKKLYLQAIEIKKGSVGKQHPSYAMSLNNLGRLYESIGDYDRAEPLLVEACDIARSVLGEEHPDYASLVGISAGFHDRKGETDKASQLYREAWQVLLDAASRTLYSLSEAQARAWIREHGPRTDRVIKSLRSAPDQNSSEAYAVVWKTKGMVSRLRIGRSLSADASPEARQAFAELRDARLKLAKLVTTIPPSNQVDDYRQTLTSVNARKETLEKKLAELNSATAQELAVRDAQVEDLLKRLPPGVAVIDFARLADWGFVDKEVKVQIENGKEETRTVKQEEASAVYDAFVLRSDRPQDDSPAVWVPLGAAEPIEALTAAWCSKAFGADETADDKASSAPVSELEQRLRSLIWDNLEPHLQGIHTVVVIPDGDLHRLPWAALPGREPGTFLIEDYALATASSGQQLYGTLTHPPVDSKNQLLVVGGIDYDKRMKPVAPGGVLPGVAQRPIESSADASAWSYLAGTQKEAAAIVGLWGDRGTVNELTRFKADEHALASSLPDSRFAHLATHGFFDKRGEVYGKDLREQRLFDASSYRARQQSSVAYRNPLLMTGIVLAGANVPPETDKTGLPVGDDGILTAEEIAGLDLRKTELISLSACETGLGDITPGQGVFGLQRALHQAGVRTTIASLWKVDDVATQALMIEFYRNLWEKDMSKVAALRRAQLAMLNRFDAKAGELRGQKRKLQRVKPDSRVRRLDPRFWAAFQLSGDWR